MMLVGKYAGQYLLSIEADLQVVSEYSETGVIGVLTDTSAVTRTSDVADVAGVRSCVLLRPWRFGIEPKRFGAFASRFGVFASRFGAGTTRDTNLHAQPETSR